MSEINNNKHEAISFSLSYDSYAKPPNVVYDSHGPSQLQHLTITKTMSSRVLVFGINVCGKDNTLKELFESFHRNVIKRKLPLKKSIFTD